MKNKAPDYSKYTHTFSSYCYAGPNDGHWHRDGVPFYTGKDLRTVEGYKEYKDAGMDIYFPQTDARITTFYGGNVKTSEWAEDFFDKRLAVASSLRERCRLFLLHTAPLCDIMRKND